MMTDEMSILRRLPGGRVGSAPRVDVADGVLEAVAQLRPSGPGLAGLLVPAAACVLALAAAVWAFEAYSAYADPMKDLLSPLTMVMQ